MGAQSQLTVIYFALLVIMLYPFTQMSLYVADRHFYVADVASNLYRCLPSPPPLAAPPQPLCGLSSAPKPGPTGPLLLCLEASPYNIVVSRYGFQQHFVVLNNIYSNQSLRAILNGYGFLQHFVVSKGF